MSFNFMSAVTVLSDFAAQENKICHCFYFFPIQVPWFLWDFYENDLKCVKSEIENGTECW